jgi:hypothetical protein
MSDRLVASHVLPCLPHHPTVFRRRMHSSCVALFLQLIGKSMWTVAHDMSVNETEKRTDEMKRK